MSKQKITYTEAVVELEKILADLESNTEVNMDIISEKIKRATVLIETCKRQLHEMDVEIEKMMSDLNV